MPGAHPKPYESELWQHLDTIQLLRRQRKTWAAIAAHLEQAHELKPVFGLYTNSSNEHRVPKSRSGSTIPA
jgi:hypothetical protein